MVAGGFAPMCFSLLLRGCSIKGEAIIYTHALMFVYIYIYIHAYTYTYTCIHMYIYIYNIS